tara:strand:- start:453 stop:554 length:102 start_codon:yes stop_codon:yes gene_type:complete
MNNETHKETDLPFYDNNFYPKGIFLETEESYYY